MSVSVSKANRALLVPATPAVTNMFPDAPMLGEMRILDHTMRETLLLRHLGFDVPNPMLLYYNFPGPDPAFSIQKTTCKLMTECPHCYVLNAPGTGKTRTTLWAWDFLYGAGIAKKLLVVCKKSNLYDPWAREMFNVMPHRKFQVLYGSREERLEKLAVDADVYIINHDGLEVVRSELQARADIDAVAIDELAAYRNNNDRSKIMRKFVRRFAWVWGLTGSPMPHEPTDAWGQAKIINPGSVPDYRTRFKEMVMEKKGPYRWVAKPDAVDKVYSILQPSVRFTLDDVTELPEVIYKDVNVELTPDQKSAFKQISNACAAVIRGRTVTAANGGVAMGKLLQVVGGWLYTNNPEFVRLDALPRIVSLVDIIEETDRKVIVFVPYRHMLEGLSKIFSMKELKIDHCVVHGDTPHREVIFNHFQGTSKYKVMLCHPITTSHGLTLTAADTIIWYLPVTSWETYEQANARIRRIGQKHRHRVIHLISTPLERKIYKVLRERGDMQQLLLDMVEEATEEVT